MIDVDCFFVPTYIKTFHSIFSQYCLGMNNFVILPPATKQTTSITSIIILSDGQFSFDHHHKPTEGRLTVYYESVPCAAVLCMFTLACNKSLAFYTVVCHLAWHVETTVVDACRCVLSSILMRNGIGYISLPQLTS